MFSVLDGEAMTPVPQEDCKTMMLKDKTTVALPYRCGNPHTYGFASERAGEVGAGGAVMPRCFARRTDHLVEVCWSRGEGIRFLRVRRVD